VALRKDVIILGAGIVGVSAAIHLQKRDRSVVLVDRRGVGEETSFGNAGLIQREAIYPYAFPRDLGTLLRYATNRRVDAHYHLSALPKLAPFLFRYWKSSEPAIHHRIARLYAPLIEHSLAEHIALADAAGASQMIRPTGWLKIFRTAPALAEHLSGAEQLRREFGIQFEAVSSAGLARLEPDLRPDLAGGIHWTQPGSVQNPHALVTSYAELFRSLGGEIVQGDARSLEETPGGWTVAGKEQSIQARDAVVALGPWAEETIRTLGYRLPMAVKRGYHRHYVPDGATRLHHPILDVEGGYMLAPMERGIRLVTGAEFALRDAPSTPVQIARAEAAAREIIPLGSPVEAVPWLGARPCTADMMPIIGPATRHKGLWFGFGHAHHGFTAGPVTGRLLAEMITGESPVIDPRPYRPDRF
jgi:D-amino-acid dehydrogenase